VAGPSFWSPTAERQGVVAILIKENFEGKIVSWNKDSDGRILSLLLELPNVRINLVNIYAPVNLTECKSFFENLHKFLLHADHFVIGGDFNCYDHALDKFGGNISIAPYLSEFRSTFKVVDIWRRFHPNVSEMSWWNANLTVSNRLDKFYISKSLTNFVQKCDISPLRIRHVAAGRSGAAQFRPPSPMRLSTWTSLLRRSQVTSTLGPSSGCGKTGIPGRNTVPGNLVIGFVPTRSLHALLPFPLPRLSLLLLRSGTSSFPCSIFYFFWWLHYRFWAYP